MSELIDCTISSVTSIEATGDTGAAGNMITSATLFITPNSGFTVSAADFRISAAGTPSTGMTYTHGVNGVTLPTGVDSVTFSNVIGSGAVGVPYSKSNLVKAVVALTSSYAMPSSDTTLSIDVRGAAHAGVKEYYSFAVGINSFTDQKATVTVQAFGADASGVANTLTSSTDGRNKLDTISGKALYEPLQRTNDYPSSTKIGVLTVTADSGYYLSKMPSIGPNRGKKGPAPDGKLFLQTNSQTVDERTGLTSEVIYDLVYFNENEVESADRMDVRLQVYTKSSYSYDSKLYHMEIKRAENGFIHPGGQTAFACVYGTPGAKFALSYSTQINNFDGTKIGPTEQWFLNDQEVPAEGGDGFVASVVNNIGYGKWEYRQDFRALKETEHSIYHYYRLKPIEPTTFAPKAEIATKPDTIKLEQIRNTRVRITNSKTPGYSVAAAATITKFGKQSRSMSEVLIGAPDNIRRYIDVDWTLTGSGTFTVTKQVVLSDFTNTDSTTNGGTEISPRGLRVSGHGTNTVTIKGKINVDKFGDTNVDFNLNLDNIVSFS